MAPRRAVFLDRDGVINSLVYHRDASIVDSPFTVDQFRILAKVPRAIRLLNDLNLAVVVVSNQPGIAKGHFSADTLRSFDRKLKASLSASGAHLEAIYYCLHHPDAKITQLKKRCRCRKPGIGLLRQAARDLGIDLANSYMVGDGLTDIEAGIRAGCRTVFVGHWKCEHCQAIKPAGSLPALIARDLYEAAKLIRSEVTGQSASCQFFQKRPSDMLTPVKNILSHSGRTVASQRVVLR